MRRIENVLGYWVFQHRWWCILLTIPVVAFSAAGMGRLRISKDTRVFFSEEDPRYRTLEALENTYSREQGLLYIIAPKDADVFTRETLTAVAELTAESWEIPHSLRVNSIVNFQYIRAEDDDLIVEDLVPNLAGVLDEDLASIRRTALSERTIVNRLVSPSGHVTGVHVALQLPADSPEALPQVASLALQTVEDFRTRFPQIDFYVTGSVIINHAFGEASRRDLSTLAPVMFFAMVTLIGITLHSVFATLAAVVIIVLSMVTGLGLAGWAGMTLNAVSVGAPGLILTLAVADSVHILTTLFDLLREGKSKHEAVAEALRINLQAVFLTSITTIIGFLSMNFSESPPFRDLGNIVALGVSMAFVFSVLLLPALMAVLPVSAGAERAARIRVNCGRVADFVIARREPVFRTMLILAIILGLGTTRIELNDNFLTYFDETFEFRRATDFLIENLAGWDFIEYSVPSGRSGGIHDPEYLTRIDQFAQWYRRQPKVVFVTSIAETVKRLNRDMNGGDERYYCIPDRQELIAQYLLFYELSLPFGSDLNNRIDVDRSATRFHAVFQSMSAKELRQMDVNARRWLNANWPEHMHAPGTGLSLIWAYITQRNIISMLRGSLGALVLISAIMVVALRSVKFGLLSLVPNLLPPVIAFGLWGISKGQVGLALSVVVAMTIGIVVDDTVHFLSKYRRARREHGLDAGAAVRYAFQTVGTAMWVTSVALTAGFLILTRSHYRLSEEMGIMCAVTIVAALVMDFLLLPTLLLKVDRMTDKLGPR
jgi:predicted RND superfamily exporter protein